MHQDILDATDFGGYSTRKRMYLVATVLDAPFQMPTPIVQNTKRVWEDIVLPHWDLISQHDITDLKTTQDAIRTGWARVIRANKPFSPSLLKAQGNDTKDAVTVERDGRYYRLPVIVQKEINSIPEQFDADWLPKDKAAQVIGQSIDCGLHGAVMAKVREHIVSFGQSLTKGQISLVF